MLPNNNKNCDFYCIIIGCASGERRTHVSFYAFCACFASHSHSRSRRIRRFFFCRLRRHHRRFAFVVVVVRSHSLIDDAVGWRNICVCARAYASAIQFNFNREICKLRVCIRFSPYSKLDTTCGTDGHYAALSLSHLRHCVCTPVMHVRVYKMMAHRIWCISAIFVACVCMSYARIGIGGLCMAADAAFPSYTPLHPNAARPYAGVCMCARSNDRPSLKFSANVVCAYIYIVYRSVIAFG